MPLLVLLYRNAKPHTVFTHALAFSGGFLFADNPYPHLAVFIPMVFGVGLLVAAAGALNNVLDRNRDGYMARTRLRPLASGMLSLRLALLQVALLLMAGGGLLGVYAKPLTVLLGLGAFLFYVAVYSVLKRRNRYGTLSGGIPGSLVVLAGYTVASGGVDTRGVFLFVVVLIFLSASYYKVAARRQADYVLAGLPTRV